jgi:hypothetical protein
MKKIILAFSLLFIAVAGYSQTKFLDGTIHYTIAFEGLPEDDPSVEMLKDATMKMVYAKDHIKVDMDMVMAKNIVIIDTKKENLTMLLDIMGNKYAITMSNEELKKSNEEKSKVESIEKTESTKTIAGYVCNKYIVKMENKDEVSIWATTMIKPETVNPTDQYDGKLDAFPLEYTTVTNGMTMKMTATKVNFDKVNMGEFDVPADYKPTTMEELGKAMSGE